MVFLPDNSIFGDSNANLLVGTTAQDAIFGLQGADSIVGGEGIDGLYGNADADILYGAQADDFGFGGQGNDLMFGGQGNDQISGDSDNDTLYGDKGADILTGGTEADVFVIAPGTGGFSIPESDLIIDFTVGEDLIQLAEGLIFTDLDILANAGNTVIQDNTTGEIFVVLQGVDSATITVDSFLPVTNPPEPEPPTIPDFEPPVIQAALANDTGVSGTDFVTSDPTIIGGFNDNVGIARLEASLDGETFTTVFPTFNSSGNFVLGRGDLEFIRGSQLTDGSYALQLRAVDTSEQVSEVITVSFTLATDAPQITAGLANDTGDSNTDGVTTDATINGTILSTVGIVELRAGFAGTLTDISDELGTNGQFSLSRQDLEILQGAALVDNTAYILQLEAMDQAGLVSTATVSFTFDAVSGEPPEPPIVVPGLPDPEVIEDAPVEVIEIDLPDMGDGKEREVTADPGNTLETALDIAVSSNTLIYSEQVSATDPEDLYVFSVGASSNLMLSLGGLNHDADLFLLDSNGTEIQRSERLGISDEFITQPLTAGTYFIQVKALEPEVTDYNLNVTAIPRDPDISTGGSEEEFELFTDESTALVGLVPAPADPSGTAFRTDPRFAGIDGSGFATVIIDTGIDLDHPFFGPDADGNGIADRIVYQYDFADNDADASDVDGHGSNVSSIVASEDPVFTGMAPSADIIHLKVFSDDPSAGASFGDIEEALQWVVENAETYNIASVNMSLGGGNLTEAVSPEVFGIGDELAALTDNNVIVVSAAGNSFFEFGPGVSYPAADPNSLAVGAVWDGDNGSFIAWADGAIDFSTGEDQITSFSQRHPELLDIFAPGAFITGANQNGETVDQGGTSQASPHIAGIAVLAQELAVQELGRRLTFDEFNSLIQESGDTIFDGDDEDDNIINTQTEYERVNVLALGEAILALKGTPPEEPPTEPSLVRYDFAYLYDGLSVSSDYYFGYTYAEPGSFDIGTLYDVQPMPNEAGENGLYFVFGETAAPETSRSGEVFVSAYADVDASNTAYTPYFFSFGLPSGFDGMGSELDFVATTDETTGAPIYDAFGLDFFAADVTTETFTNTQWTRADYFVNQQPGLMVNGDLDADGDEDLIVTNTSGLFSGFSSGFSLLFNSGDGSFEAPIDFETDFFSSGAGDDPTVVTADFDGDGVLDVANAEADSDQILLYFGDSSKNYSLPASDRPILREAADLDGDGSPDLLTINSIESEFGVGYFGNTVSIYYNDGAGNFPQKSTVTVEEGVQDVTAADLDGDGDLDLATANERTDTVSVLFNQGSGTFTQAVEVAVGDRPNDIVADDFDGDGNLDLATANFGDGTSSVLLSNGDGTFAAAIALDSGANPSTLSAADLDGDGQPDLIMRNSVFFNDGSRQGNQVTLLLNQGDGSFAAPESFTVGDIPQGLVVADFDNNGQSDFATSNFDSQDVTVYLQSA
ncbi:MAG: FG-GAP-like repeat-containing protein [Microcoleaceae cyanobacterium]